MIRGEVQGASSVIAGLRRRDAEIDRAVVRAMAQGAKGGEGIMKGKASGPPGPYVRSGDFRRSIVGQVVSTRGGVVVFQVGSNAPQARRLEYGFVGPDVLGRVYNQAPRPYAAPSLQPTVDLTVELLRRELASAIGAA